MLPCKGEEERTKKGEIEKEEKQLLDFRSSQENQKSKKTFGAWIRVWLGENKYHIHLFQFLAFTLTFFFAFTLTYKE